MKLIIDIPEKDYQKIHSGEKIIELSCNIVDAIASGTPIPDNATNGDVIKALFPDEHDFETDFDEEWWNAPYQKGGKE